jgi:arylsulfatase A-like enzyme
VIVVLDDSDFAHSGYYSSNIETSDIDIDLLASVGLRSRALTLPRPCPPSRACALTGRNHYAVGMRAIFNMEIGFPK